MVDDVHPYSWGQLCRHVEAELARTRELDEAARKELMDRLGTLIHSREPRPGEGDHGPVCSLCGIDRSVGLFVRGSRGRGGEVDFVVVPRGGPRVKVAPGEVLFCWSCLYEDVHLQDASLELARGVLTRSAEGAEHMAIFERVWGHRVVRSVEGWECALCERWGAGLRGPPGVHLCLGCHAGARAVRGAETRRWDENAKMREERYDAELADYLAEMWVVAREDARGAMTVMERRGELGPSAARPAKEQEAAAAIVFLDGEVVRALRHRSRSGDLMGNEAGIAAAYRAFAPKELSRATTERMLQSLSMLRQVLELGTLFYGYTGDELIHEEMSSYEVVGSWADVGIHEHVPTAIAGGLIVSGGTRELRARAAGAIRRIVTTRERGIFPSWRPTPCHYIEAETLYSMSEEQQAEVRRQMLITPPIPLVLGTDDLDRFIEETPRRVRVRLVTYLFMNGQEHLDLNAGLVHVGPPPPSRTIPRL